MVKDTRKEYVYFIQDMGTGYVKIGYAKYNPFQRISSIQTSTPNKIEIKGIIQGTLVLEQALHSMFYRLKVRNEWFKKDVLSFLDNAESLDLTKLRESFKKEPIEKQKESKEITRMVFINENLNFLLKDTNLSALARDLKISKSLIADWASYRRKPSMNNMPHIHEIAKHLNISFEDLLFKDCRV